MAKGAGKLSRRSLKSVLKKWKSSSSLLKSSTNLSPSPSSRSADEGEGSLHPVYVGKSRRRYLISSQVVEHPLFQELVDKSADGDGLTVGCEVVLFEHLLWMLENADSDLQDLVHFYAC